MRVAGMALAGVPNGGVIYFCIQIALYILLNPVPEFIYQTRTTGLELLSASYNFIVDNWIEWLLPNIVLGVAGYWLLTMVGSLLVRPAGILAIFSLFFRARSVPDLHHDFPRLSFHRTARLDSAQPFVSLQSAQLAGKHRRRRPANLTSIGSYGVFIGLPQIRK